MKIPLTIDGVEYPHIHITSIKRSFSVLDGENAGRLMTGKMERDIIGTYYNYSCEVDPYDATPDEYDRFYEVISAPQDSHVIVVPYGQSTYTFEAYVANGDDELLDMFDESNRWGALTFNFVAMEPARTPV